MAAKLNGRSRRSRRSHLVAGCAAASMSVLASCTSTGPAGGPAATEQVAAQVAVREVPPAVRTVMDQPDYKTARLIYAVTDLQSGDLLLAHRENEMVFTGSTAKLFTIGTAFDVLGPDHRVTTPVYATTPVQAGVVHGDLALVASGDLAMGGRGALAGKFNYTFDAHAVDHVYGDIAPNAVIPKGNPLAGLDDLARQVAAKGVTRVAGDVVVDERLWQPFDSQEGVVPAIFVNDNLLDITVTPAARGETASVAATPRSAAFSAVSQVKTVPGSDSDVQVAAAPADPHRIIVSGTIGAAADPHLTVYRIPDAASWARALFIEALERDGITVDADPLADNPQPPKAPYQDVLKLASLQSPPLREFGKMILATSYNTGANAVLCDLAVHEGSTDCLEGLQPIRRLIDEAGLVSNDVVLVDGQGADPASTTPMQMVAWLRWTKDQSWSAAFDAGLPVLGESGTLASVGQNSPARGKVVAKTGTSAHPDPATGRVLLNVQSLAGFMRTDDGRTLVLSISLSGATYPDVLTTLVKSNTDVAAMASDLQQTLSR